MIQESDKRIINIVQKQRKFFAEGTTKTYGFRMAALTRLELALDVYEGELNKALQKDLNKSASESYLTEIGMAKKEIRYVKKKLRGWMRPQKHMTDVSQLFSKTYSLAEPYGIVLIMAPWNYPLLLCLQPMIEAIAAGNCVVLKPSAYAPTVASVLGKMLSAIYPPKYVAVIKGGRNENAALLDQRFDYIFFTGGVSVGKIVLEKASRYVTPVTLELGGKSPCIVDKSADLRISARRIAFGKLINGGQTCVAPDYLLVHEDIKEPFLEMLKQEIRYMEKQDALQNTDYPKIINEKHYYRLKKLMESGQIVFGGRCKEETLQIEPTILDHVALDSAVMQEEIFGPILPVLTFSKKEEIVQVINHFEKPLAFYLFTKDKKMKDWVLQTFSFGGGCINNTIMHVSSGYMPFGGVGSSGMGEYHGQIGFETFSHRKSIVDSYFHPDVPLKYQPYTKLKDFLIRNILK